MFRGYTDKEGDVGGLRRICNKGYYSVAGACQPCPTGQYGDAVGLTACKPCTNAPSGTYYLNRIAANAATQDNTCPW